MQTVLCVGFLAINRQEGVVGDVLVQLHAEGLARAQSRDGVVERVQALTHQSRTRERSVDNGTVL